MHLLANSSAKDPDLGKVAEWDIHAHQKHHHWFGVEAHHCLEHFVTRRDIASALRQLAKALIAFDIDAVYKPDNGNASPDYLSLMYDFALNFETIQKEDSKSEILPANGTSFIFFLRKTTSQLFEIQLSLVRFYKRI